MYSFIISLFALVAGYFLYGRFVEKIFGPDPSKTVPSVSKADGVDFIKLPSWKVFMIQFLNIAGTGPIFGAIMGAKFGPSAYLWIVFGCIFAGAVHDYFTGMLSVRNGGAGLPELVGKYLGGGARKLMLAFSLIVLILVGVVFVYSPALILGDLAGDGSTTAIMIWVCVIFLYYVLATLLPVDKVIAKIYPFFAFALIFMAVGLMVGLFVKWPSIPEIWDMGSYPTPLAGGQTVFPCLFITIACGAVSGFHGTQSPLMARCIDAENHGRPVFYGAMITEGCVALVWAAVSSYFFFDGGAAELGSSLSAQAPEVVTKISSGWLGIIGGILAIIGVVAAPITSGDTAFRSSRLMISDFIKLDQKPVRNRFLIAIPMFLAAMALLWFNISNEDGFNLIWRYFGWANQTLAAIALWMVSAYLLKEKKGHWYLISFLPAVFMTSVCVSFICISKIGFGISDSWALPIAGVTAVLSLLLFYTTLYRKRRNIL